jgi:hypothetical protein
VRSLLAKSRLVGVVAAIALSAATTARAEPDCPEMPCSVIRNCSSTGIACELDDRACAERARERSLEVKCEQQCTSSTRLVYCPPDTGRSDSKVVWVLLAVAVALAAVGSAVAWVVLRKKDG